MKFRKSMKYVFFWKKKKNYHTEVLFPPIMNVFAILGYIFTEMAILEQLSLPDIGSCLPAIFVHYLKVFLEGFSIVSFRPKKVSTIKRGPFSGMFKFARFYCISFHFA